MKNDDSDYENTRNVVGRGICVYLLSGGRRRGAGTTADYFRVRLFWGQALII